MAGILKRLKEEGYPIVLCDESLTAYEQFVPKRLTHYWNEQESYTKVIIPVRMVMGSRAMVDTGHYHVTAREAVPVKKTNRRRISDGTAG